MQGEPGTVTSPAVSATSRSSRGKFTADIARRVERGEHLTLWGPRGSGKTTLLNAVQQLVGGRHCGFSATTRSLDDITCALERAYGDVATGGLKRRAARGRLWWAADAESGVLLLDHVTNVGTAMKGWLRRLRGGLVGVVLAVDVDSPREWDRLRARRLDCTSVRIPPMASRTIARQLVVELEAVGVPRQPVTARRVLVRAARGRPGWVVWCATLATHHRYWRDGQLKVRLLATDTELCLRGESGALKGRSDLVMARAGPAQST